MQLYEETLLQAAKSNHPTLKPEKLQAFVLWYLSEAQTLENSPDLLKKLEQTLPSDIQACYEILSQLEIQDLIGYALVNEFGPRFIENNSLSQLFRYVVGKRLSRSTVSNKRNSV